MINIPDVTKTNSKQRGTNTCVKKKIATKD